MMDILAKFLLITIGFILQLMFGDISSLAVMMFLFALIISGINDALNITDKPKGKFIFNIILIICLGACSLVPEASVYIPAIIYELVEVGNIISLILSIAAFAGLFFTNDISLAALLVVLSVVSCLLYMLNSKINKLQTSQHVLRDTSAEREMLIERNNRSLRESQDANVYAATLKERNRIAREIHDNVGHMLTRSILQTGAIRTINKNEALDKPLSDLSDTLNQAMTSIRSSVHDLHDESVDLKSAMEEIIASVSNMTTKFEYDMSSDVKKDIKYSFLAITKEAVNNAVKHSNGDTIIVVAREHPGFYQLMIADNGTVKDYNDENGIGLLNMKERVESLNGRLKITTEDGFKILITVLKG